MVTPSKSVNTRIEKLEASRSVPRVNLPALARRDTPFMQCWQADPGKVFISSDFVSLEPCVTASFAEDEHYRYATHDGVGREPWINDHGVLMVDDVYLMTASVMPTVGVPVIAYFRDKANCRAWVADPEAVKEIPQIKKARKQAKPACLGFNYGMGPRRFVNQCYEAGTYVTYDEAKAMYKAYWNLFSGIQSLVKRLEAIADKQKYIENPFGYRLSTDPYKAYNAFIQSTASGVLDVFCLKFFASTPDTQFVAMIHDEVIYQVPESTVASTRLSQERCLESLNADLKFRVPMRLGFTVARTFAEIK